jgi:hypothetical protein
MTTLLLPPGFSIRTLISPSSTWIERTCARAMPSTSQIRANACSSAGASSPTADEWALTLSMVQWWVVAQRRRRGVRNARGQRRPAGCSRRRRCEGLDRFPSFPSPLLRSAPCSCAESRATALPHRSLPRFGSSSRLSGKQRNHGQRPLHVQTQCVVLFKVLQQSAHCGPNPQLTSERVQTGRQSDVTEKQSQRLECHFGVTGMILFATRYRQPAGEWGAPSAQPNSSDP